MSLVGLLTSVGPGLVRGEVQWCGVDYFRHTLSPSEVEQGGGIDVLWLRALAAAGRRDEGTRQRPITVHAYRGKQVGDASILVGPGERVMAQVTGSAADEYVRATTVLGSISRLDLQITGRPALAPSQALVRVYHNLVAFGEAWPHRGRRPDTRIVYDRAVTVYSGRRSRNGVFVRCYDAGAVHGHKGKDWDGTVRIECEVTGERAARWAKELEKDEWAVTTIAAMVAGEANWRGALLRWQVSDTGRPPVSDRSHQDTQETTMLWLARQVRPAVRRLLMEGVSLATIRETLGVETPVLNAEEAG